MNSTDSGFVTRRVAMAALILALLQMTSWTTSAASIVLQGQNKGDAVNWYGGNLQNWQELDYIPCRVHFTSAQGNNQAITLSFEHRNNNVPGIQNLFNISSSNNVVITSAPVLSAPPGSSTWSY